MLSGRGLCDELITRPEESYRLWRVVECDLETSKEEAKSHLKGCEHKTTMGCDAERKCILQKGIMAWRNVNGRCDPLLCTAFRNVQVAKKLVTVQGSGPEE